MSAPEVRLEGSCHCGALAVAFETRFAVEALKIGRCDCSFCRRHGARTCSDPGGRLRITEAHAGALHRYRFGLKTADFLLCRQCGVYIAAVIEDGPGWRATLNINTLEDRDRFDPAPPLVSYAGETAEGRRARRLAKWTPTRIEEHA